MASDRSMTHRAKMMLAIGKVVRPNEPQTRELAQQTLEALCAVAGCLFAVVHKLPYDEAVPGMPEELAQAAIDGMVQWKEQRWNQRQ